MKLNKKDLTFIVEKVVKNTLLKEDLSNENYYTIDEVLNLAKLAGEIVFDVKDALEDLVVAYGDLIPKKRVDETLYEYDMNADSLLNGDDEDNSWMHRSLVFNDNDDFNEIKDVYDLLISQFKFNTKKEDGYTIFEFPTDEEYEKASNIVRKHYGTYKEDGELESLD